MSRLILFDGFLRYCFFRGSHDFGGFFLGGVVVGIEWIVLLKCTVMAGLFWLQSEVCYECHGCG